MKRTVWLLWVVSVVISWSCSVLYGAIVEQRKMDLAVRTLKSLYEFEDLDEFGKNVDVFRSLVTPEVFTAMTADNTDRILRIYLKFNGEPSRVDVMEVTPSHIVYGLACESIERERIFMFSYEERGGKITVIREAEIFKFPTTRAWDANQNILAPLELPLGGE